jgi:hypothetical protein
VIEYFSEGCLPVAKSRTRASCHPRTVKDVAEEHGVSALKLPVEIIKTQ